MAVMLERWNDDKMDALEGKVDGLDKRIDRVDTDLREQRQEMKAGFGKVDDRLEKMRNTMVYAVIAMSGTFVTGFGTLALILVSKS